MNERHVIRCQKCKLNQFMTLSGNCRKCKTALIPPPAVAVPVVTEATHATCAPSATSPTSVKPPSGKLDLAFALRLFLRVFGWTQQNLADKMGVPRTYISKLTRDCCDPSLKSFRRLCAALEVSELAFITIAEAAGRGQ